MERVVVEAPATSANLGSGFDVFALALKKPNDRVTVSVEGDGPLKVELKVTGGSGVSQDPRQNAAGVVALGIVKARKLKGNISIELAKGVPVGVGLGSSGASSAASAVAIDKAFELGLKPGELVRFAGMGERATSGAAHLDNVTAAIMGGFVLVPETMWEPISFQPPARLRVVVVTPEVKLPDRKTEYARGLVPEEVKLQELTANVAHASRMVAGFARGDIEMIGQGMEDAVVEPARASMVPGLDRVKRAARSSGAVGTCISGAGPSVLALVDSGREDAGDILSAMRESFNTKGVESKGFVTSVGGGARVVESS